MSNGKDDNMIYYISDLHIGHKSAIRFDERPFADIDEMEREIIRRWNEKVTSDDDVYILGDVFYRYKGKQADFLRKLRGRLHLITGNHDKGLLKDEEALSCFADVDNLRMITDNGRQVVMCHFPIISWNMKHYGSYHVYGHIHKIIGEEGRFMINQDRAFNAGCMINGYVPCTLEELEQNNRIFRDSVSVKEV